MASITSLPSGVFGSSLVLISEQTASSSSTIDFTSGIDSTYKEYQFHFIDIHPQTDAASLVFQADTGTNTNYNQTMTTTMFRSYHSEDGSQSGLGYITTSGEDQAQETNFQKLIHGSAIGNDNDQSGIGILQVFEPSSSTFVKHFISRTNAVHQSDISMDMYVAGYFNTTTALTRFRFKMDSGNMDSGTIKMYGVV
tara:strand:- start:39 stop:626 length:588 start_codon:yes stop_codon:yes gene_type:complete